MRFIPYAFIAIASTASAESPSPRCAPDREFTLRAEVPAGCPVTVYHPYASSDSFVVRRAGEYISVPAVVRDIPVVLPVVREGFDENCQPIERRQDESFHAADIFDLQEGDEVTLLHDYVTISAAATCPTTAFAPGGEPRCPRGTCGMPRPDAYPAMDGGHQPNSPGRCSSLGSAGTVALLVAPLFALARRRQRARATNRV